MDHERTDFSGVIRTAREDLGLTVRGLSRSCKAAGRPVSWSQISKIERGISRPLESTVFAIALGLGSTVAELRCAALDQVREAA